MGGLEHDAQAVEDASTVAKVRTALLEWDEALRKAREDLAGVRAVAAEWETEVAATRAQLQQDRATLEGALAWQSQAEEKAKEAEELRTTLADKAASLASTEEQLRQERDARQQAEAQLQQERAALAEPRATHESKRMAREEAQGLLQRERVALEKAQTTLKQRDEEVSRLNGELTQLSVSLADQRQAVEEQEAVILGLQRAAEAARNALEAEKKQVEGESLFICLLLVGSACLGSAPNFCFWFIVFRLADRPGELDDPGSGYPDGLQLLATGAGRAMGCRPLGVPGGGGRRGAGWELDGESPPRLTLGVRLTETDRFGSSVRLIRLLANLEPIGSSENSEPRLFGFG
jgi:hypothetical protein